MCIKVVLTSTFGLPSLLEKAHHKRKHLLRARHQRQLRHNSFFHASRKRADKQVSKRNMLEYVSFFVFLGGVFILAIYLGSRPSSHNHGGLAAPLLQDLAVYVSRLRVCCVTSAQA